MRHLSKLRKVILSSMSFMVFTAGSCSCSVGNGGEYKPNIVPASYNRNFQQETTAYSNLDNDLILTSSVKDYTVTAEDIVANNDNGIPTDPQIGNHANSLVVNVQLKDNPIVNFDFVVDGLLYRDQSSNFTADNVKQIIKSFFHNCAYGIAMSNFRLIFVGPSEGNTITSYTVPGSHGVVITWPFETVASQVPRKWDLQLNTWTSDYLLSTWNHEFAHFEYYNNTWAMNKGLWYSNDNTQSWNNTQLENLSYFYTAMGDENTGERLINADFGGLEKGGLLCSATSQRHCNTKDLFPSDLESYRNDSRITSILSDQNYEWSWAEFNAREVTQLSYVPENPESIWKDDSSITSYVNDYLSRRFFTQETAYGSNNNGNWSDDNWRKALTEEQYWYGDLYGLGNYDQGYSNINKIFPIGESQFVGNINIQNETYQIKKAKYYNRFGFGWYSSSASNAYPDTITMNSGSETKTLSKHVFQIHYALKQTQNSNMVTPYNDNKYLVYYLDNAQSPIALDTGHSQTWELSTNLPSSQLTQKLEIDNRGGKSYIETV